MTAKNEVNAKAITSDQLEKMFDNGDDILDYVDMSNPVVEHHPPLEKRITLTMPAWMVGELDEEDVYKRQAYTVRDLTEQEAIEQADSIWLDCLQASQSDSRRLGDLEASSLDQDEALAEIYQLLAGGEA